MRRPTAALLQHPTSGAEQKSKTTRAKSILGRAGATYRQLLLLLVVVA